MVFIGATYWIRNSSDEPHLYFVITEPDEGNKVLLVNMTDIDNISDRSCVLTPGDHKTITKKSVVHYGDPIYTKPAILEQAVRHSRKLQVGPNIGDKLIKRIQKGALKSEHLAPQFRPKIKKSLL